MRLQSRELQRKLIERANALDAVAVDQLYRAREHMKRGESDYSWRQDVALLARKRASRIYRYLACNTSRAWLERILAPQRDAEVEGVLDITDGEDVPL